MPRPGRITPGRPTHCRSSWAGLRTGLDGQTTKSLAHTGVQTPDRPVRRESLRPSTFLAKKHLFWEAKSPGMWHWITRFAFTDIITALRSFETSWHSNQTAQCHIPKDHNPQQSRWGGGWS